MNQTMYEESKQQNHKNTYGNSSYNHSSTLHKRELDLTIAAPRRRQLVEVPYAPKVPNKRNVKMSFGYLFFLVCALVMVGYALMGYIKIQAEITSQVELISSMESELNDLTIVNEEEYTRLMSSVNLDEINRVARQELGMVNASSDQIIVVSGNTDDYVTQKQSIPNE